MDFGVAEFRQRYAHMIWLLSNATPTINWRDVNILTTSGTGRDSLDYAL
jgi:hypothetical protein